jgi:hypothetical protein
MQEDKCFNKDIYIALQELEKDMVATRIRLDKHELYTEKALDKTEEQLIIRLASMNEFREQLRDQSKTFMTVGTYDANHKLLESKIEALQKIVWGGLAVVSFLAFAIPVFMHFF